MPRRLDVRNPRGVAINITNRNQTERIHSIEQSVPIYNILAVRIRFFYKPPTFIAISTVSQVVPVMEYRHGDELAALRRARGQDHLLDEAVAHVLQITRREPMIAVPEQVLAADVGEIEADDVGERVQRREVHLGPGQGVHEGDAGRLVEDHEPAVGGPAAAPAEGRLGDPEHVDLAVEEAVEVAGARAAAILRLEQREEEPRELRREVVGGLRGGGPPRAADGAEPDVVAVQGEPPGDRFEEIGRELAPIGGH